MLFIFFRCLTSYSLVLKGGEETTFTRLESGAPRWSDIAHIPSLWTGNHEFNNAKFVGEGKPWLRTERWNNLARFLLATDLIIIDEVSILTSRVANSVSLTLCQTRRWVGENTAIWAPTDFIRRRGFCPLRSEKSVAYHEQPLQGVQLRPWHSGTGEWIDLILLEAISRKQNIHFP
jgi:hypothetical protein